MTETRNFKVATVQEMAEAHLLNVDREIKNLMVKQSELNVEIERLSLYLEEGRNTVQKQKNAISDSYAKPQDIKQY
jgi:hypothetical protein